MTSVLINPGSGPVQARVTKRDAVANIKAFLHELQLSQPSPTYGPGKPGNDGRWSFVLRRGVCRVTVDMPGIPLGDLRGTFGTRLYVNGSSFFWKYAIDVTRGDLEDHDGSKKRAIKASERAAERQMKRNPWCKCGAALAVDQDDGGIYHIICYVCDPLIEERRESVSGAWLVSGWEKEPHYVVRRQYQAPQVPGHDNPNHVNALCSRHLKNDSCRLARFHKGSCEPYWKELERTYVRVCHD